MCHCRASRLGLPRDLLSQVFYILSKWSRPGVFKHLILSVHFPPLWSSVHSLSLVKSLSACGRSRNMRPRITEAAATRRGATLLPELQSPFTNVIHTGSPSHYYVEIIKLFFFSLSLYCHYHNCGGGGGDAVFPSSPLRCGKKKKKIVKVSLKACTSEAFVREIIQYLRMCIAAPASRPVPPRPGSSSLRAHSSMPLRETFCSLIQTYNYTKELMPQISPFHGQKKVS